MEARAQKIELLQARVIIADPNEVYRAGVKSILAGLEWAGVVGEAGDETDLADLLETTGADLVLVDPEIAVGSDVSVIGRIRDVAPDVKVVVVTDAPDRNIKKIIRLGADGYLLKVAGSEELASALRLVAEGRHYIQADLIGPLLEGGSPNGGTVVLPAQHLEILRLVTRGLKNKQVAREFGMSVTALKSHLRLIYSHLDASSRVEAVAAAIRLGIVE